MNLKKALVIGLTGTTLYFGGSLYCDQRNLTSFLETHQNFTTYKYLQLYDATLDAIFVSMKKNNYETKDLAEKVEKDLLMTRVHTQQLMNTYDKTKIVAEEQEWMQLHDKKMKDSGFFVLSLLFLGAAGAWYVFGKKDETTENHHEK